MIALVNVVGSTIARECDGIYLHSGPEISVASTKAFTSMLAALSLLALHLGRVRDLGPGRAAHLIEGLRALPDAIESIIAGEAQIKAIAEQYASADSLFFIGRHRGYPIALEGAQKLKEISYIHAEAYASAELKHGPLALVSPDMPTVAVVPDDDLLDKNTSTLAEIKARRGPVIAVAHHELPTDLADRTIVVPKSEDELDPILMSVPLQILAYHAAVALDRDVDKPRNLAKSVTVE